MRQIKNNQPTWFVECPDGRGISTLQDALGRVRCDGDDVHRIRLQSGDLSPQGDRSFDIDDNVVIEAAIGGDQVVAQEIAADWGWHPWSRGCESGRGLHFEHPWVHVLLGET